MSKLSYQRLLRARYGQLRKSGSIAFNSEALDLVLAMPHPHREVAFVAMMRFGEKATVILNSIKGALRNGKGSFSTEDQSVV